MALLRTGLVLAGGYAERLKRVFFAQVKDSVKRGELKKEEAVRSVVELNKALYKIIVEELKVDKGDVVRISLEYEIKDGTVHWKMDSLSVEVWPRCPPPKVYKSTEKGGEAIISEEGKAQGVQGGHT
ncbi:MAG: DUF2258 domain-containing protein [Acidilobaceae archaeon]|nr:DUF2258 domain-containing protein [Acidilobaceae archaeon]MCX8165886.1 DUF2258 domain-containing protein [Acidilobaceae archaeon]MDW7974528.1 DUF2258 domain-containing protein [Sulfolobales archaeon]